MICPYCRENIPDDSHFCDQCGKELLFCPECGKPKRGTMCAACGAELIGADAFFQGVKSASAASAQMQLCGEGLNLILAEGNFGRDGGIWPALASFQYISRVHGRISRSGGGWAIEDLGSTNGTKVNGKRLAQGTPCPLEAGDIVIIATTKFEVK